MNNEKVMNMFQDYVNKIKLEKILIPPEHSEFIKLEWNKSFPALKEWKKPINSIRFIQEAGGAYDFKLCWQQILAMDNTDTKILMDTEGIFREEPKKVYNSVKYIQHDK